MQVIKKRTIKDDTLDCKFVTAMEKGQTISISGPAKITIMETKNEGHKNQVRLSVVAPLTTRIRKL